MAARRFRIQLCFGSDAVVLQDRKSILANERAMMSSAEPAAPAARVGADLRLARERLEWTLPVLAAHLRIRLVYLEALEDGRIADLPGVAYAVGFLRTYAQVLGLDPDEISRRFRAEAAEANRKTVLNFPAPVPERGMPAGAIVLIGALLAIGVYVGWYRASGTATPAAEMVEAVPERLAPLAETVAPPVPVPVAASAPVETPAPQTEAAAAEPPPPPLPVVSPSSAAAAAMPPAVVPDPAATRIVVHAKADSWIQVRDKSGQVLFNRVLRGGEAWPVPDRPALLLTTGNAGGTELLVDGATSPALGNDGVVRRDLPLDADAIKSGRLAPLSKHP